MTMDAIAIEIEELTAEQAAEIWQEQKKRPANYPSFVMFLQSKEIDDAFNVKVQPGDKNDEHARSIRKWFGEAAKERKHFETVNGKTVETSAPVALRWKEESHKEKRTVTKDGKKGEVEVKIIDRLHGKLVPADSIRRGRGASGDSEQVDDIVARMTYAAGSKTLELPDGRKAKLTRSGHWRAPKQPTTASTDTTSTNGAHANTSDASTDDKVAVGAS